MGSCQNLSRITINLFISFCANTLINNKQQHDF